MPICRKNKILFVHIPKCAGSSIAQSLGIKQTFGEGEFDDCPPDTEILYGIKDGIVLQSLCLEYYNDYIDEDLNKYKILTCVRNPYERIISDYSWYDRRFKNDFLGYCKFVKKTLYETKDKKELMKYHRGLFINHFLPQYEYINNTNLDVKILYVENLDDGFNKLFPDIILEHINKSKHDSYESFLKDKKECVSIINEIYKIDFEKFGYKML